MDCMIIKPELHLALRPYGTSGRDPEECLPSNLEAGSKYDFEKKGGGRRIHPLSRPIPLHLTYGNNRVQRPPIAAITIIRPHHDVLSTGEIITIGQYRVECLFSEKDPQAIFDYFADLYF